MNDPENFDETPSDVPQFMEQAIEQVCKILSDNFAGYVLAVETGERFVEAVTSHDGPMSMRLGLCELLKKNLMGNVGCRPGGPEIEE
jgi:hypothetical protein